MSKEYCMICGKENTQAQKICKCGGKSFVFGDDFTFVNKKVECGCGSDKFQMVMHMNRSPIHDSSHKCSKCNNVIGIQTYVENPFMKE